jgi:hypothetical protein
VLAAVGQHGWALRHAAEELKDRYGRVPAVFLAAVAAAAEAEDDASSAQPPAAKRAKPNPTLEARLKAWMKSGADADPIPTLLPLDRSAYLRQYDGCPPPRTGDGPWSDPVAAVTQSLPEHFEQEKWAAAQHETREFHTF